jgi:hypothetical protein
MMINYLLKKVNGSNQSQNENKNFPSSLRKEVTLMLWYSGLGRCIVWYVGTLSVQANILS